LQIFTLSGDGSGAGKSTLARKISGEVLSIASPLRQELCRIHPGYAWWDKTQAYKDNTIVEGTGKTVRQMLVEHSAARCAGDPLYWARQLSRYLEGLSCIVSSHSRYAIDDLRKVCEIEHFRDRFGDKVTHIHVLSATATPEPHFDNDKLRDAADYVISWERTCIK